MSDLPYALVTPGKWEFSDGGLHFVDGPDDNGSGMFVFKLDSTIESLEEFSTEAAANSALSLTFDNFGTTVLATRASLPGHLCDRAVNAVEVTGPIDITLPFLVTGKSRDFYLKMTVTGSQDVSFFPATGITYTGFGDPAKTYSAGTYVLRFTETTANEFCVTDMLAEYADVSTLSYALVTLTPQVEWVFSDGR